MFLVKYSCFAKIHYLLTLCKLNTMILCKYDDIILKYVLFVFCKAVCVCQLFIINETQSACANQGKLCYHFDNNAFSIAAILFGEY